MDTIRHGSAISREKENQIVSLYCVKGMGISDVSKVTGICYRTVWKYLKLHGINTKPKKVRTVEKNEEIVKDYMSGMTYAEVAKKHGITSGTVESVVKLSGEKKWNDRRGYPTPVLKYDLEGNMLAEYKTMTEACEKDHVTIKYIRECCKGDRKKIKGYTYRYRDGIPQ